MKTLCPAAVCCVLLCLLACQKQAEQPSMTDDKMAQIVADLSLAEAATQGLYGAPKDSLVRVYTVQVFKIHGTSLEEHEKNLKLISQDTEHLRQVLQKAEEILKEKSGQTGVREKAQAPSQN